MKLFILNIIPPIIISIFKYLSSLIKFDKYLIENKYKLIMPHNHMLIKYKKSFIKYDNFLPIISKYLKDGEYIVDVGANIGDTAMPLLVNNKKVICIEPSDYFFEYLKKNIEINNFKENSYLFKYFISKEKHIKSLNFKNGTASSLLFEDNKNTFQKIDKDLCISLDDLFFKNFSDTRISLIKVDTDGFDYDVLFSAENILLKFKPFIFFENFISKENVDNYHKMYDFLRSMNYNNIFCFDNYGNLLSYKIYNWEDLKNLNNYIINSNFQTIQYYDVFVYTDNDIKLADEIISDFKNKYNIINL